MLSTINIRLFSNDQYVLDKVLYSNYYRVKRLNDSDVVLDIGAHAGFFAISASLLGSKKVYCYEPLPQNYEVLLKNTEHLSDRIKTSNISVFYDYGFVDFKLPVFNEEDKTFDFNNISLAQSGELFARCVSCPLEHLIDQHQEDKIKLLKISIGGGELQLLEKCSKFDKVENIVGETPEEDTSVFQKAIEHLKNHGFVHSWFSKNKEDSSRLFIFSKNESSQTFEMKEN